MKILKHLVCREAALGAEFERGEILLGQMGDPRWHRQHSRHLHKISCEMPQPAHGIHAIAQRRAEKLVEAAH